MNASKITQKNKEQTAVIRKARQLAHDRDSIVILGREPRFTRVERMCRQIRDGNIWQLSRWLPRLRRTAEKLARLFEKYLNAGHAPELFPGLQALRDIDETLTFAKGHLYDRTKRSNPVGTGGIPRRLVRVSR